MKSTREFLIFQNKLLSMPAVQHCGNACICCNSCRVDSRSFKKASSRTTYSSLQACIESAKMQMSVCMFNDVQIVLGRTQKAASKWGLPRSEELKVTLARRARTLDTYLLCFPGTVLQYRTNQFHVLFRKREVLRDCFHLSLPKDNVRTLQLGISVLGNLHCSKATPDICDPT